LLVVGCDLNGFHMIRTGEDDDEYEHYLCFLIYAKDSIELHEYVRLVFHADTFLTFEKSQMDLPIADASKGDSYGKEHDGEFASAKRRTAVQ